MCVFKCWCEAWDTENLRCQANRLSHVMTDESYRKFFLINNIILKMWFNSLSVHKNSVDIQRLLKIHFYGMLFQFLESKPPLSTAAFSNIKQKSVANETYWHNGMSSLMMHFPPFLQYSSGQTANIKVKIVISPSLLLHLSLSAFQNGKILTPVLLLLSTSKTSFFLTWTWWYNCEVIRILQAMECSWAYRNPDASPEQASNFSQLRFSSDSRNGIFATYLIFIQQEYVK